MSVILVTILRFFETFITIAGRDIVKNSRLFFGVPLVSARSILKWSAVFSHKGTNKGRILLVAQYMFAIAKD